MSLNTIYAAIENMSVNVNGTTANVYGLTNVPSRVETAHLPLRAIVSVGGNTQGQSVRLITLGGTPNLHKTWAVQDLMLYKPVPQGQGLKEATPILITYIDDYLTAVRTNHQLTSGALITDVRLEPGVYEHPPESGAMFYGVMVSLTVEELE